MLIIQERKYYVIPSTNTSDVQPKNLAARRQTTIRAVRFQEILQGQIYPYLYQV